MQNFKEVKMTVFVALTFRIDPTSRLLLPIPVTAVNTADEKVLFPVSASYATRTTPLPPTITSKVQISQ
jgi:hypothetical protein